jgi:hypothetical protein
MKDDQGVYRRHGDNPGRKSESATLEEDLQRLVASGEIKFQKGAVVVFLSCGCAGSGRDPDINSFASEFSRITGATVVASLGPKDQSKEDPKKPLLMHSTFGWVKFTNQDGRVTGKELNTNWLNPLLFLAEDMDVKPKQTAEPQPESNQIPVERTQSSEPRPGDQQEIQRSIRVPLVLPWQLLL